MRDEAPAETQTRIINDIKSSESARRFESTKTQEERKKLFIGGDGAEALSQQEQKIILEAVADNPLQLTHLRSAVQQLPQDKQKQFYENVLAEASTPARQQYAQHVRQEKEQAARDNRSGDVERLTREERVITSKKPFVSPAYRSRTPSDSPAGATLGVSPTAPQVDAIKPNGKKPAATPSAPLSPTQTPSRSLGGQAAPPSFAGAGAPRGKVVEGTETVVPGEAAAPTEGVPVSAMETFKEKLRKTRTKEVLGALLNEVTAYLEGLKLLRQQQLEQGLAEAGFEVQNTDRLITEAELLIEEIKKQLAKFSS